MARDPLPDCGVVCGFWLLGVSGYTPNFLLPLVAFSALKSRQKRPKLLHIEFSSLFFRFRGGGKFFIFGNLIQRSHFFGVGWSDGLLWFIGWMAWV
jgi:hypothetical protein